jgi:cyclopropane fatty-acyl-phospholipid synthase-like methyltransferase
MFEHLKNYELLFAKVSRSLRPDGKLFVQVLCQRDTPYDFEDGWMSKYFFTSGTMPSADLFFYFQEDVVLEKVWWLSGTNYARTLQVCFLCMYWSKTYESRDPMKCKGPDDSRIG